ncbi:Non-catalytic module family DOC2 [Piromyces sp. E2]|nr:Non-catalytic module family DOC2 [Piromyces sp. E2]|eukprot:OUM64644.1 Non-catalytic module family DOC2 [Piromyces sp. E2]
MIFTTFVFILCWLSVVIEAIDTDYTVIKVDDYQNTTQVDLYIHNNSEFIVSLEEYYSPEDFFYNYSHYLFSNTHYWILENEEELLEYGIKAINLKKSVYPGDHTIKSQTSISVDTFKYKSNLRYLSNDEKVTRLISIFKFRINNSATEDLPQIKFIFKKNDVDHRIVTINLLYAETEAVDLNTVGYSFDTIFDHHINDYGYQDLWVNSTSYFMVTLDYEFDYTLTFENENMSEFKNNKSIELVSTASIFKDYIKYIYLFKVNEIDDTDVLRPLYFSYKKPIEGSTTEYKTAICTVYLHNREEIGTSNYENGIYSISAKKNGVTEISFKKLSSEYEWILSNLEEVRASNEIELLKLDGIYIFKIRVKETDNELTALNPLLKFTKVDKSNKVKESSNILLYLKGKQFNEIYPTYYYPTYPRNNDVVYVESFSVLEISITGQIKIDDEIKNSKNIVYLGKYASLCAVNFSPKCNIGGPSYNIYKFFIKEVNDENELPKIKMNTNSEIILKLKSSSSCSLNGYKCCSNANASVLYQDKDGDWSVENGDWCIINKDKKEITPELIRICEYNEYDKPCCTNEQMKQIEEIEGTLFSNYSKGWGICGLPTCIYTGDYPICQSTTSVVYTDTEKWGVENNEWCVMCL